MGKVTITRALLSVSDKSGLADLGAKLAKADVELISTGGTARALREAGLDVRDVSEVTLVDANRRETAAVSMRGAGLELARTGIVTIAIADLDAFYVPVNLGHGASFECECPSRPAARNRLGRPCHGSTP